MTVLWRKQGQYGYVELASPPVNAINQAMRQGLLEAVRWAEKEGLERVILSGQGKAFAAGADAREFDSAPLEPHLPEVIQAIAQSRSRWIAAVSGPALGGGAEIMLACHYRIARPDASIGFPEVTLGIVPGAGGTQLLPRLIGVKNALDLVAMGKAISGREAKAMKLVDELDDDPVHAAAMVNSEWLGMAVPVVELNCEAVADSVFEQARTQAKTKSRGQQAPLQAIELVQLAQSTGLAEGMKAERAAFLALRQSPQAKALRHIFFAERGAKAPDGLGAPLPLHHIVVVGGGTMGAAITYALLNAGYKVTVLERDAEALSRARHNVEAIITASLARKLIDEKAADNRRASLTISDDYAQAASADMAIEAAFEHMAVKQEIVTKLQQHLPPSAIIATNTSYLDVDEIAAVLSDPARLIGLHFFAPAHIMKLVEIIRGQKSSSQALATGFALAQKLRKIPVLAGVCDGFIGNRILARYREAADTLLMDGATPWQIDEAMEEFGYAMGPYEAQDLSGLDIAHANRRRQDATRNPARRYIPIADRMVAEGRLGRKVSVGWYRYPGGGGKVVDPLLEDMIREEAHFAKVTRGKFSNEEISRRLLLAMINEAAAILQEGIASSAADIDLVTVHGYGFPRWRGGLMFYADALGAQNIRDQLLQLAKDDALVWQPNAVIEQCAAQSQPFATWRVTA